MKVMALRIAAYLLILQFVIVAALDFVGKSGPDYIHLLIALGLLITS